MGITPLETLHRMETENTDGEKAKLDYPKRTTLRTTRVSRLREPWWQLTLKKPLINKFKKDILGGKKQLTSWTEERIGFDRSQPSFTGTYEEENKE